jgi:2-hydroxymethylglutarate dehydrogenase
MKIGFIGLGNMGKPMANNLLKAGHILFVHDKRREATEDLVAQGAQWAGSPKAAAQASEITLTSLPEPSDIEQVALGTNGIIEGAPKGHFYVDTSTSTPATIRKIAAIAATKNVEVLDAPVTGGVKGATDGSLTVMVGGSHAAFEFCKPILECIGKHIFLVGDIGAGCVAKLVNNMMALSNLIVAMEAMVFGVKAGVDAQKLFEVATSGSANSMVLNSKFPNYILKGHFELPGFSVSLAAKDMSLATGYAKELGIPIKISQCASNLWADAVKQGLGWKETSAYITLLEKAVGVEVRSKSG